MNDLTNKVTVTSLELFEMLDYRKIRTLHLAIRSMIEEEIKDGLEIVPSLNPNGSVAFCILNEVLSRMFIALHYIDYTEEMNKYWVDKKSVPKVIEASAENMMAALGVMARMLNLSQSEKLQAYAIGMQASPNFVKALPGHVADAPAVDGFT